MCVFRSARHVFNRQKAFILKVDKNDRGEVYLWIAHKFYWPTSIDFPLQSAARNSNKYVCAETLLKYVKH